MNEPDDSLFRLDQEYGTTIGDINSKQDIWITSDQSINSGALGGRINRDNGDRVAMDLFGETKLPRAKAPQYYFVKSVQSPQGGFPIGSNIESRHSENKSVQYLFQRIQSGKTFDRRASASSHKREAYRWLQKGLDARGE